MLIVDAVAVHPCLPSLVSKEEVFVPYYIKKVSSIIRYF